MNINAMNLKERSNESKLSSNYNLNVCTASKGSPQDELNTNKHQFSTAKKVTERSRFMEPALAAPTPATVSRSDDINN